VRGANTVRYVSRRKRQPSCVTAAVTPSSLAEGEIFLPIDRFAN
jgi:hypothetical protein